VSDLATRRTPGPARRFELPEIDRAALRVVEEQGFAGLSLRAVARELDVTPAALYTYVRTVDELRERVIDLIIARHAQDVVWPDDWADVLRTFASGMRGMLAAHPAMIEAFAAGVVLTPAARDVVEIVMMRLVAAGFPADLALHVYATVHAVVLGHSLLHSEQPLNDAPAPIDPVRHPTTARLAGDRTGGIGGLALEAKVEIVIAGVSATWPG
jgi:AcrR family transcriptional regulator